MQEISCNRCLHSSTIISGNKFERLCPIHADLAGLWLLNSSASDHSTPYLEDFLTYKELHKPVQVSTVGSEVIYFTGIGTMAFTTMVQDHKKTILFHKVFFSPSGNKHICSLQWLTTQLNMTYATDVKKTVVLNSWHNAFLEGTRLLPNSNLHWFIRKPYYQKGALGLYMNLDIKSVSMVNLITIDEKSFNDYKLWHAHLGHLTSQTL